MEKILDLCGWEEVDWAGLVIVVPLNPPILQKARKSLFLLTLFTIFDNWFVKKTKLIFLFLIAVNASLRYLLAFFSWREWRIKRLFPLFFELSLNCLILLKFSLSLKIYRIFITLKPELTWFTIGDSIKDFRVDIYVGVNFFFMF